MPSRLGQRGSDSNGPDLHLHSAAVNGNIGLVKFALKNGQSPNSELHGVMPIHAAASAGHEAVVRMLIEHGADVNAPRLSRRHTNDRSKPVPGLGTSGSTALHFAAANGHSHIVELLLANGARVDVTEKRGLTPAAIAKQMGHEDIVQLLKMWDPAAQAEALQAISNVENGNNDILSNQPPISIATLPPPSPSRPFPIMDSPTSISFKKLPRRKRSKSQISQISVNTVSSGYLKSGDESSTSGKKHLPARPIRSITDPYGPPNAPRTAIRNFTAVETKPAKSSRRPSLPSVFERAAHPAATLKQAFGLTPSSSSANLNEKVIDGSKKYSNSLHPGVDGRRTRKMSSKSSLVGLFKSGSSSVAFQEPALPTTDGRPKENSEDDSEAIGTVSEAQGSDASSSEEDLPLELPRRWALEDALSRSMTPARPLSMANSLLQQKPSSFADPSIATTSSLPMSDANAAPITPSSPSPSSISANGMSAYKRKSFGVHVFDSPAESPVDMETEAEPDATESSDYHQEAADHVPHNMTYVPRSQNFVGRLRADSAGSTASSIYPTSDQAIGQVSLRSRRDRSNSWTSDGTKSALSGNLTGVSQSPSSSSSFPISQNTNTSTAPSSVAKPPSSKPPPLLLSSTNIPTSNQSHTPDNSNSSTVYIPSQNGNDEQHTLEKISSQVKAAEEDLLDLGGGKDKDGKTLAERLAAYGESLSREREFQKQRALSHSKVRSTQTTPHNQQSELSSLQSTTTVKLPAYTWEKLDLHDTHHRHSGHSKLSNVVLPVTSGERKVPQTQARPKHQLPLAQSAYKDRPLDSRRLQGSSTGSHKKSPKSNLAISTLADEKTEAESDSTIAPLPASVPTNLIDPTRLAPPSPTKSSRLRKSGDRVPQISVSGIAVSPSSTADTFNAEDGKSKKKVDSSAHISSVNSKQKVALPTSTQSLDGNGRGVSKRSVSAPNNRHRHSQSSPINMPAVMSRKSSEGSRKVNIEGTSSSNATTATMSNSGVEPAYPGGAGMQNPYLTGSLGATPSPLAALYETQKYRSSNTGVFGLPKRGKLSRFVSSLKGK